METLAWHEFFIFGGIWFWGLAALEIVFLLLFTAIESFSKASFSIFVFLLLLVLFGKKGNALEVVNYIKNNPIEIFRWSVLYLCVGIGWALFKTLIYTNKVKYAIEKVKPLYVDYCKNQTEKIQKLTSEINTFQTEFNARDKRGIDQFNDITRNSTYKDLQRKLDNEKVDEWKPYLYYHIDSDYRRGLDFGYYRRKIIFWICFVPFSIICTIFTDLFTDTVKWIYDNILVGIFKAIYTNTVGKALKFENFETPNSKNN